MLSNHLILCLPLLLLPSIFPRIRVFSNESALLIRWPKYWSFNFSISPSSEYSGLISFRIDWFDLLAGDLLIRWTLVGKEMSLLFNMLFRFIIAFLPRNKHLLISWLQSPSTVILQPKKIKSITASTFLPSLCHKMMGPDSMILVFEC